MPSALSTRAPRSGRADGPSARRRRCASPRREASRELGRDGLVARGRSNDAGALLEPLGVAISHVHLGDDVLVVGAGPIGVLAVQVARLTGARRVFVSEPLRHRRKTARRSAADGAWLPDETVIEVGEATGGRGVDVVIELAGVDPGIATAVACARPGARVALAGIPDTASSSFPASGARRKGLTFVMVRRMHGAYPRAIDLATTAVDLDALVTGRWSLTDAVAGFTSAASRSGDKTVIVVSDG